jgi:hypothetical protein
MLLLLLLVPRLEHQMLQLPQSHLLRQLSLPQFHLLRQLLPPQSQLALALEQQQQLAFAQLP